MDGRLKTNNWSEICLIVTEFKNTLNHFLIVTSHATWILEGQESGFTPRNQWNRPKKFNCMTDKARLRLHCCHTPRQLASDWVLTAVPAILIVSGVQRQKGMSV